MTYCIRYDNDALKKIKDTRTQNDHNSKQLQVVFNKLKEDPLKNGEKKPGRLKDFFNFSLGRSPEFRLIYKVLDCTPNPLWCKTKSKNNCKGLIDIVAFVTRSEADKYYNGKRTLTSRFEL